jgi:hypothetical protein
MAMPPSPLGYSFFLVSRWTALALINLVGLLGLGFNQTLLSLLVERVRADLMLSKLAAIDGVFLWTLVAHNFIMCRDLRLGTRE